MDIEKFISVVVGILVGETLEKVMKFAVYLEEEQKKSGCVAVTSRQHHPPVCQELACRAISPILPQNRLHFTLLSNSRHYKESELALAEKQILNSTSFTLS